MFSDQDLTEAGKEWLLQLHPRADTSLRLVPAKYWRKPTASATSSIVFSGHRSKSQSKTSDKFFTTEEVRSMLSALEVRIRQEGQYQINLFYDSQRELLDS